jgi:hypothetical protein
MTDDEIETLIGELDYRTSHEACQNIRKAFYDLRADLAAANAREDEAWDEAKLAAMEEAKRQGNVYRSNSKPYLSAETLSEWQFAADACNYVASAIRALKRPTGKAEPSPEAGKETL